MASKALSQSIPPELLSTIITDVISHAITSLCNVTSVEEADTLVWERNVINVLASISFSYRDVTREVVTKAFYIKPKDGSWVQLANVKLTFLYRLGLQTRCPHKYVKRADSDKALRLPDLPDVDKSIPIFEAYYLFWNAYCLRRSLLHQAVSVPKLQSKIAGLSEGILRNAHAETTKIYPRGLVQPLISAVKEELESVELCRQITDLDESLQLCLQTKADAEVSGMEADEKNVCINGVKNDINSHFETLEILTPKVTIKDAEHTKRLVNTLFTITATNLEIDEHDLHRRAEALHGKWLELAGNFLE